MTAEPNTIPPAPPGGRRRMGRPGSANPYALYVDLDRVEPPRDAYPPPPPPPADVPLPPPIASLLRPRRAFSLGRALRALAIVAVLLGAAGSGAAYAGTAYARSRICADIATLSAGAGPDAGTTAPAGFSSPADQARRLVRLLVFEPRLHAAVDGLATDGDDVRALRAARQATPQERLERAALIAGHVDGHLRDAQRACGQPITGITGRP
ncbi:hypothetical protein [Dactylosporangium sp. CA-233914]|uniref:hypothetical protein n=1 Tax=Dactylosporangium sp. CA-233914 TaxID=3239934 RepID=UPI003D8C417A